MLSNIFIISLWWNKQHHSNGVVLSNDFLTPKSAQVFLSDHLTRLTPRDVRLDDTSHDLGPQMVAEEGK